MKPDCISAPEGKIVSPRRDWSRILSPSDTADTSIFVYKNCGVTVTVWDAEFPYDTLGAELIVSLDTEYQFNKATEGNDVLSYQVTAMGRSGRMAQLIFHVPDEDIGHRLSLSEIIDATRKALDITPRALKYARKRPAAIRILCHFSTAEWSSLRDRAQLAPALNIVRKSPISLGAVEVPLKLSNRMIPCGLELVDTTLIAPAGFRALSRIGEVLSFPKVTLPPGAIEKMAELRRSDRALFDHYAITDTRIALAYYLEMQRIARDVLGLERLGPTLGSLATSKYLATIGEAAYLRYFGLEKVKENRRTRIVPVAQRAQVDGFAAAAFMGGLNMAYPREVSDCLILDIDFTSCYPSAGSTLPAIDWSAMRSDGTDIPDGSIGVSGSASTPITISYVEFEFPDTCLRPCIPVMAGSRGIIYPSRGAGYATHFELQAALRKGAEVNILRTVYFPPLLGPDGSPILAFADYFRLVTTERGKYPKGSLENLTYKETANSTYGKLAQGVKSRMMRSFDSRAQLPPSRITCPAYACAITGLVRAALVELMDAAEDVGGVILAATTDGAMIAFPDLPYRPEADLDDVPGLREALMSMPAIAALSQGRVNSGNDPSPVEVKHVGDNALIMKTRGYILRAGRTVAHIAKCGHQLSGDLDTQAERLEGFFRSDRIGEWTMRTLASAQKVWDGVNADPVRIEETRRVNVDFDFKVIPDGRGGFRPPVDLDEFDSWRTTVDNIRRKPKPGQRGFEEPESRATIDRVMINRAGIRVCGGEEKSLRRMFIYALAQDRLGLYPRNAKGVKITQAEFARRAGVTVVDVKNARRRTFVPPPETGTARRVLLDLLEDTHGEPVPYSPTMGALFATSAAT